MHTLLSQGAGIPRAWIDDSHDEWDREARSYGPDDDDDGEADDRSGLWSHDSPDEDTQEIVVQPMPGPLPVGADDYDDDRR